MKQTTTREAISLLRTMTRILCTVGILALVFTTVNVTHFATSRGVPGPIALLLDPMIGTTLTGVLYADARLASWGIRPPAWSTTLRWSAGCTAALMNTWDPLWPDRQIGWPHKADPAAVLLHLTPALLLIALTETIAAYRRCITDLLDRIGPADPPRQADPLGPATPDSCRERTDPDTGNPDPLDAPPAPDTSGRTPAPAGTPDTTSTDDLWPRATALDATARSTTGKPVSIWKLRTDLHIGPRRARQIHEQLLARHPSGPPQPPKPSGPAQPLRPAHPDRARSPASPGGMPASP